MDSIFYGDANGSFFSFDMLSRNRKLEYPMLPESLAAKLPGATKLRIQPKQPGEKRILSVDVALMASTKHKNDATAIFINQLIPTKAGRYTSNIVYGEVNEGFTTDAEALRVRKLKEEYDADLIVLDTRGLGIGVFDALIREINDPDSGEVYPALSCCNNAEMAARCKVRNAEKAIWAIMGSSRFNSDCALGLREGFRTGRIRLLISEFDAEELLGQIKGFSSLGLADRSALTMPYINTTLLINELINLQHEEVSGLVRLYEKPGARKDRYSSLSYSFYVANQLEKNLRHGDSDASLSKDAFIIRAPKNKLLEGRR